MYEDETQCLEDHEYFTKLENINTLLLQQGSHLTSVT